MPLKLKFTDSIISKDKKSDIDFLSFENAELAYNFHKTFPDYQETSLFSLKNLAKELGVAEFLVKDESTRFNLNSFKALGSSFAIGSYIIDLMGKSKDNLNYSYITSNEVNEKLGDTTFITATDGNHGRGVAYTSKALKKKAMIFLPKGSSDERVSNIKALGATAIVTELNYDDTVNYAAKLAKDNNWVFVQDTAYDGYEEIPKLIMQGYLTLAYETLRQLKEKNITPTHIFLQAGVGSFSSAITGFFANVYGDSKPVTIICEPNKADCVFRTANANDGKLHTVSGDLETIMAGLACGVASTVGFEILKDYSDGYLSFDDTVAARAMRILSSPIGADTRIISGESGSAGCGGAIELLTNSSYDEIKTKLKLDKNSKILCFSTEGATDLNDYRKIVYDGSYPY